MQSGLRRSFLFAPGSDQRKLLKAAGLGADAVIMDLEDSVAESQKAEARRLVCDALRAAPVEGTERLVRVNALGTPHVEADLAAVVPAEPDGIVVPKVDSAEAARAVEARVGEAECNARRTRPLPLFLFIESARGLVNAGAIAAASPRLAALFLGHVDLATDLGLVPGPATAGILYHVRCQFALAARAAGADAVDTVFINVKDLDGFRAEAEQAAAMGYTGKLAIHPSQVTIIHAAFTPPLQRVQRAERILAAWATAQAEGRGAFSMDGQLIEKPVVEAERRLLARARRNQSRG